MMIFEEKRNRYFNLNQRFVHNILRRIMGKVIRSNNRCKAISQLFNRLIRRISLVFERKKGKLMNSSAASLHV